MAKRLRRTSRGTVILPSGEKITLSEQRALRSAVNSANRKRKRVLAKMPANRVSTKQVDESWYYRKKSVKLNRFKNKAEFNRYLRGVQKIASGKFEQIRGRTYFENYKQAIRTAFGKTYKFSSNKKREMFNKRLNIAFQSLEKLQGRLFRICGENLEKCYNLSLLYERACDKVYSDMLYK